MVYRSSIGAIALAAALCAATAGARAWDDAKYPNWKGQWFRTSPVQWKIRPSRRRAASRRR